MHLHNPVVEVLIDSGKVEVRQLPFIKAIEFLKMLAAVAGTLFTADGKFKLISPSPSPAGAGEGRGEGAGASRPMVLDVDGLQAVVAQGGDLMEFVLLHSTRKDRAWLDGLSLSEGLLLLKHALELNTAPEILALGNDIAGVLAGLRKPAKTGKSN
jgi:hypothetical protein